MLLAVAGDGSPASRGPEARPISLLTSWSDGMPQERLPVAWLGEAAVITLPEEIDISNSEQVREELLSLLNRGPAVLIVDMAETTFCDSAGVNALVRAHRRATASDAEIRLVLTSRGVERVLAITGVDRLITTYPSVAAALNEGDAPAGAANPDPDDRAVQPS
jgi:anti-sigma B factor antagonist